MRKIIKHKYTNDKNYVKVKGHCHYTGKCIYIVVFHNGSNYDSHFIIKELL